jgi:hypothetical protein
VSLRRLAAGSAAALVMLAVVPAWAGHEARRCSAPEELTRFRVALPNMARAIRQGAKLVIVAIGSSSTEGVGASDPAHTYPAVLADELRRRWPHLSVTVINKGISGELVSAVLGRFERDVLATDPSSSSGRPAATPPSARGTSRATPPRSRKASAGSRRPGWISC